MGFDREEYKRRRSRRRKVKRERREKDRFYTSREWYELRYQALKLSRGCCELCGAVGGDPNNPLHVDHIKPRARYPELELKLTNLQILCRACNMGKGARDMTNWKHPREIIP